MPILRWRLAGCTGVVEVRVLLDIFTDLLQHAGISELEERDRTDDQEYDDRDGSGKAVVDAPAPEKARLYT